MFREFLNCSKVPHPHGPDPPIERLESSGTSLALTLPAMNIDDRTKMLGGMQAGAPPEVLSASGPQDVEKHHAIGSVTLPS